MSKNTPLKVFLGIKDILNDPSIKVVEGSSRARMKFTFFAPDRMALASKVHEEFDKQGVKYNSVVKSSESSFPSDVVTFNDAGKVKSALIVYKPSTRKSADAKTTAMQEKASTYVFERVLKHNESWDSTQEMMDDKKLMKGIRKVYPSVEFEWMNVFFLQHKRMIKEFSSASFDIFDHSGNGSFMDYVSELVNKKFGVTKKDNWDPADMWMIKGSVADVKKKIEDNVAGSKGTQTIEELNATMREMYKKRILVGISLKKVSGRQAQFEEFNIEALTLDERDDYNFPNVDSTINLTESMTQDTVVKLTKTGGKGYKFQIKGNNSTDFSNLKWEATQLGAGAARGGKAQVDQVVQLLKDNGKDFDKSNGNYPKTLNEYESDEKKYTAMFNRVKKKADTGVTSAEDFSNNIKAKFLSEPHVANSKLMQLAFLDAIYSITPKKDMLEVWTDMVFLAIKKGNKFGPFGKLY